MAALALDADGQQAVCSSGAAKPLVWLTEEKGPVRQEAISILCQLAQQAAERPSLITAGVVPPLVAQLSEAKDGALEAAACALDQLSGASGGPSAMVSAGGIRPLVSLMQATLGGPSADRSQAHAVAAMHNLARCAKTISAVASDATAISANVKVLEQCANAEVRAAAAATLGCVSDSDSAGREAVVSCGGVGALHQCSIGATRMASSRLSTQSAASRTHEQPCRPRSGPRLARCARVRWIHRSPRQCDGAQAVDGRRARARAALACSDAAIALVQQLSGDTPRGVGDEQPASALR